MFRNALRVAADEEEETRTVDLQVGRSVHTVSGAMRTELWMSVLARNRGAGHAAAREYPEMLTRARPAVVDDSIEKDVGRTFPRVKRFTTPTGLASLERVLKAYAALDPEVNYCQGMNFLAALLLVWLPREDAAYGALVVLMRERGLRSLYASDLAMLQARLWQLGKLLPPRLAQHMEAFGTLPVLYASSWLLTAFSADFPLFFSARVMDVILSDCYLMPIMKVALGIVLACGDELLGMHDMEAMVDLLRFGVPQWPHERLQVLLTEALAAEWTPAQAAVLRRVSGVESVHDAVTRTSSAQNGVRPSAPAPPEAETPDAARPPPGWDQG
ncbi:hypothetical protein WJX81_006680 [Elliptochloris bilobata]|uniref:Rab-GAP TBC domain-containing protein n=1 Tax=Elliptochloris bilobata TaxID=381761 RepID=A0AAW1RR90_9CHLO